ncbi:hypothetical protein SLE2022_324540 [Rubroshorea leprosula]
MLMGLSLIGEGTWVTASVHIIVAMIGSGLLSLAWDMAQLGWIAGFGILMAFSFITYFTSTLLADCYQSSELVTGRRNYTYMHAITAHLGGTKAYVCGLAQYLNLVGITIHHTITASISMVAVKRSSCFLGHGHHASNNPFMIIFACTQILLSQIPNFHKLPWLSILSAIMCLASTSTGLGLSIAKVAGRGHHARTSLTGVTAGVDVSGSDKVWRTFQAIRDIASAYAYSTVHMEIQASSHLFLLLLGRPSSSRFFRKSPLLKASGSCSTFMEPLCKSAAMFFLFSLSGVLKQKCEVRIGDQRMRKRLGEKRG